MLSEGRELLGADAGMVALPVEQRSAVEMVATFGFTIVLNDEPEILIPYV